jgi:uncharacterized membrane protein YhhN
MWRLLLLAVPALIAALAIRTEAVPLKLGVPITSGLILLLALPGFFGARLDALAVVAALGASAVGDYFLATRRGSDTRFVAGIGAFLIAHIGYLVFALLEGRVSWLALALLLALYIPYYIFGLRGAIENSVLSAASLVYLLASCLTFAAAFGLHLPPAPKWLYVCGIASLVISDTMISFKEFLGWKQVEWLILPTYYLAHLSIVMGLLLWGVGV